MPVLDDLATYLQAQGIGTLASSLFNGGIPEDAPGGLDQVMALMSAPGLPPTFVHGKPEPDTEQPSVQVLVRGEPYGEQAAQVRAMQAFVALATIHNQVLSGTFYLWVRPQRSPWKLKTDELQRPIIVFEVLCAKAVA